MTRRRRNCASLGSAPGDHDGILDVLANLVGVLTLVGALSAIVAANSAIRIRTPMSRTTTKEFVLLMVGKEGIWNLQPAKDALFAANRSRVAQLKSCLSYGLYGALNCLESLSYRVYSQKVGQAKYILSDDETSLQRTNSPDIDISSQKADQQIKSLINQTSLEKKAVFILLEKEGFAGYRTLRAAAANANVELGWEPWKTASKVYFGGGGRSLTVQ